MTPQEQVNLYAVVLRRTAEDAVWLGYWLSRHLRTERIGPAELAARLGLSMEQLVLLALCRSPRAAHFAEDLRVVCARVGAAEAAVTQVVRQEQALARWASGAAGQEGWLMAAFEQPGVEKDAGKEKDRDR